MLSSRVLGLLNNIITEERKKDIFRKDLLEIHIGLIHSDLLNEFEKAKDVPFYLCQIGGIKILVNQNIKDTSYVSILKDLPYEEQLPEVVIEVNGVKPTKSWLRKYGFMKREE